MLVTAGLLCSGCVETERPVVGRPIDANPTWDLPAGSTPDATQAIAIRVAAIRKMILWDNEECELPPDEITFIADDEYTRPVQKRLQWQGFHVERKRDAILSPSGALWNRAGQAGTSVSVSEVVVTSEAAYAVVGVSDAGGSASWRFKLRRTGAGWEVVETAMLSVAC